MPINDPGKKWLKKAFDFENDVANGLLEGLTGIERELYRQFIAELSNLDTSGGGIKITAKNQAKLTQLKARVLRTIKKGPYGSKVSDYLRSFSEMEKIASGVTKAISGLEPQKKWFDGLRLSATTQLENALIGDGFAASVIDPAITTFRNMVVTGSNKDDIAEALANMIIGNDERSGSLTRYATQLATDGINQYHGAVNEIIGTKFGLNWGIYVGSIIKTSRTHCVNWVNKEYIHRSELQELINGASGSGMIPGTTPSNFAINRGGYNCRHTLVWVSDEVVPEDVRSSIDMSKDETDLNVKVSGFGKDSKEIEAHANQFGKKLGITEGVEIIKKDTGRFDGAVMFNRTSGNIYKFGNTIEISNRLTNINEIKETIQHEMTHVMQGQTGKLFLDGQSGKKGGFYWEGNKIISIKKYNTTVKNLSSKNIEKRIKARIEYNNLPWEVEAIKNEKL